MVMEILWCVYIFFFNQSIWISTADCTVLTKMTDLSLFPKHERFRILFDCCKCYCILKIGKRNLITDDR